MLVVNSLKTCGWRASAWSKAMPSATWATRQRPRPWKITEPLLDYGARVFDDLAAGLGLDEAARLAQDGFWWGLGARLTEEEVAAAEGFSEAPAAGSAG